MANPHQFSKNAYNTVKRNPDRGHYDKKIVFAILRQNNLCHVSFLFENAPIIIPTFYGFLNEKLYFHGATSNRMINALINGQTASVAVTQLDALVLARSAFHHSANYHSVVLFGNARLVEDSEKMEALKAISDQILPGRWEECRTPNAKELKITKVVEFTIDQASAKIRAGPPVDEKEDYGLPFWAGLLPLANGFGEPMADPELGDEIPLPNSVKPYFK